MRNFKNFGKISLKKKTLYVWPISLRLAVKFTSYLAIFFYNKLVNNTLYLINQANQLTSLSSAPSPRLRDGRWRQQVHRPKAPPGHPVLRLAEAKARSAYRDYRDRHQTGTCPSVAGARKTKQIGRLQSAWRPCHGGGWWCRCVWVRYNNTI